MTQQEFYNLPQVVATTEVEKKNPWGSVESRRAWQLRKQYMAEIFGIDFANEKMTSYE